MDYFTYAARLTRAMFALRQRVGPHAIVGLIEALVDNLDTWGPVDGSSVVLGIMYRHPAGSVAIFAQDRVGACICGDEPAASSLSALADELIYNDGDDDDGPDGTPPAH